MQTTVIFIRRVVFLFCALLICEAAISQTDAPIVGEEKSISPRQQVQVALKAVEANISDNELRKLVWSDYLSLPALQEQATQGDEDATKVMGKSIEALTKTERALDPKRLQALSDALAAWLGDASKSKTDENADDEDPSVASGESVLEAIQELRDWINHDKDHYQQWESVLRLREIERAVKPNAQPDTERVKQLQQFLAAEAVHIDRSDFVQLRRALQYWRADVQTPVDEPLAAAARRGKRRYQSVDVGRLSAARIQLRNTMNDLDRFLNTGSEKNNRGWRKFLKFEILQQEIAGDASPRVSPLVASFAKFNGGESGLNLREFSVVRDALESYLNVLQMSETATGRLDSGRLELQDSFRDFKQFLATGGEAKESGWNHYFGWEESAPDGDLDDSELLQLYKKLEAKDVDGLDRPEFRRISRSVAKHLELLQLKRGPAAKDIFDSRMERLVQTLERHHLDPSNETAVQLNKDRRWLNSLGVLPEISAGIDREFSRPNFYMAISGDYLMEQVSDTINDSQSVNQCFEGSTVRGCATTNAQVRGVLVPCDDGVIIDIQLTGTTITQATAQQRRVYVKTRGNTQLAANKRLFITLDGLSTTPATACARTCQQVRGVCIDRRIPLGNSLIRRIARRRAAESRSRAECMANQQAESAIVSRMDEQVREMIAKSNERIDDFRDRLDIDEEYLPDEVNTRSTRDEILADAIVTAKKYLGAPSNPPHIGAGSDLAIQLHQSAINNILARMLGGIQLDNERLVDMLEEQDLPVPDELKLGTGESSGEGEDGLASGDEGGPTDEDWSLTFDPLQPATVTFSDAKFRIAIRGSKFTRGDQAIAEPIEISATYRLRQTENLELEAVRVGDVDVVFVQSPGRLSTKQLAYKTFIKRKTGALFSRRFSTDDLPETEWADQLKSLRLDHVEATRGWIALAFGLSGVSLDLD